MKETLLINRIKLPSLLGKSLGDVFLSSRIHKNINKQTCIVCRKRREVIKRIYLCHMNINHLSYKVRSIHFCVFNNF